MLLEVIKFNKKRNGLRYDKDLEIKMFNEEVREFFDADTTAGRVDALIDTMYVKLGTMSKLAYNGLDPDKDMPYPHREVIDMMINVVSDEVGRNNYINIIKNAERIVCECNAEKNQELGADGKVTKDGMKRNATKEIEAMIDQLLAETVETEEAN